MGCLLCGKEIGPLRLLRDNEFCSKGHRNRYKERLGRALSSIGQPEPAPAEISVFFDLIEPKAGNSASATVLTQSYSYQHSALFQKGCPVSIQPVLGGVPKALRGATSRNRAAVTTESIECIGRARLPKLRFGLAADVKADIEPEVSPDAEFDALPFENRFVSVPPFAVESWIATSHAIQWLDLDIPAPARLTLNLVSAVRRAVRPRHAKPVALPPVPVESWIASSDAVEWQSFGIPALVGQELSFDVASDQTVDPPTAMPVSLPAIPVESWIAASDAIEWLAYGIPATVGPELTLSELRSDWQAESPTPPKASEPPMAMPVSLPAIPVESWIAASDAIEWLAYSIPATVGPELTLSELRSDWQAESPTPPKASEPPMAMPVSLPAIPVESWIAASDAIEWLAYGSPALVAPELKLSELRSDWQAESPAPPKAVDPPTAMPVSLPAIPVESWIAASDAIEWLAYSTPVHAALALELTEEHEAAVARPTIAATSWTSLPPAPVESWIVPSHAAQWIESPAAIPAQFALSMESPVLAIAPFEASPAACEVSSFVQVSASLEMVFPAAVQNPRFELAVCADAPATAAEDPVEVVEASEQWIPSPAADAVASLVAWSEASALFPNVELHGPLMAGLSISEPFVPFSRHLARPEPAAPVAMFVHPLDSAEPIAPEPALLSGPGPIFELAFDQAGYVAGPKAMPVESMPAARAIVPTASIIAPITAMRQSTLPAATCTFGNAPAGNAPVPVEDFVFPTCRVAMISTFQLALPQFNLLALTPATSAARFAAGMERTFSRGSMPVPQKHSVESKPPVLQPMRTLAMAQPEPQKVPATVAMPQHGFVNLEFYCQRPSVALSPRLEWAEPTIAVQGPILSVRPIFEKAEELVPQKKASKKSAMAEVFAMPQAKRKALNSTVLYAMKGIAASLVMGGVLWFGVGAMRIGRNTPAVNRDVSILDSGSDNISDSSAPSAPRELPASKTAATPVHSAGTVARVRHAIADRAAATVTDSFRNGMEAWGTAPKSWAPGWSRHPEGYVQPGQLAIFNPSIKYTDYHLEFFGQIDSKSMGWTVRSKDAKNYYAMKVSVVDPGLRPIIAMVHYPVVGGKRGKAVATPLNVMVHNNKPIQVAVDVKGNRMVTSIDGQEVDTWIDDAIPQGGVGFFADAGEKARLYWMKVSKNEDFLGRVCAYLSSKLGDGSNASAEMWGPEMPGSMPVPGSGVPSNTNDAALAAAVVGFGGRKRGLRKLLASATNEVSGAPAGGTIDHAPLVQAGLPAAEGIYPESDLWNS